MAIANKAKEKFFVDLVKAGALRVSLKGVVVNTLTGNTIGHLSGGYWRVSFQNPTTVVIYKMLVHRLMWLVYRGPIPQGFVVNHKDGDSTRNRLSNFELTTDQGNCSHAVRLGLRCSGDRLSLAVKKGQEDSGYTAARRAQAQASRAAREARSTRPRSLNEGNSQYGSYWITNGLTSRKWKPDSGALPRGYVRGRHSSCNKAVS